MIIEMLIVCACCGAFNNRNFAQEELAQRQLDTIKAREKVERKEQERIEASFRPAKAPLSWEWPFPSITGLRVCLGMLAFAVIPFIISGVQCLVAVLK